MQRKLPLPGSLYLEACGSIVSRGEVERLDSELRNTIDTWAAHRQINDPARLQTLTYPGRSPHSGGTVALCRRLAMSNPVSTTTLVYAHRGYQGQCKTPLLQSLLAKLPPGLQVHALRVEQDHLPFDVVVFAIATLRQRDRCIIVKDNAIRLGTTDVVPLNSIQYLVLSRSSGSWAIDDVLLMEEDADRPCLMPVLPLDSFLVNPACDANHQSLMSRMSTGGRGVLRISRVRPYIHTGKKQSCLASSI